MAELVPDFQIRVWKYTYAEGSGANTIFLNSPQESEKGPQGLLLLRQTNSDAENKVWIQEQAAQQFKRCSEGSDERLMDDAHGVIVRDGQAKTIVRQDEKPVVCHYKRGDRIWVERSLVPTYNISNDGNKIPVIDLESLVLFWIPFDYVCFVPHFTRKDFSGEQFAASPGPVLNTFQGKRKTKARIYFHWSASEPQNVSYMWLNKKDKDDVKTMKSFNRIEAAHIRRQVFQTQWEAITKKLARLGLLIGDDIVEGNADRFESSSDSSGEDLALHWKPGPITLENCCNLSPCPSKNDPELDLIPTYIGGLRWVEHYHVQDDDLDECPQGAAHKQHCILRDNRTRCVYSTDRVRHTCCKLRANPLLPGPFGDPNDVRLPLWETTAGDEYFIDVSKNIRTREQLEDRDDIPPEMERLRQNILFQEEDIPQQQENQEEDEDFGEHVQMMHQTPMLLEPAQNFVDVEIAMTGFNTEPSISMANQMINFRSPIQQQQPVPYVPPDNLSPMFGTMIPITISPSAQTFDQTFRPVLNFSMPDAESPMDQPLAANAAPPPMMDWNSVPGTQPLAFPYPEHFNFVPTVDPTLHFDISAPFPSPQPRSRKRNHPNNDN